MAVAVIGGLLSSTALSLLCVPVAFVYMDRFQAWVLRHLSRLTTVTGEDVLGRER
ncbi:MAG: hypothetical protein Q4B13_07480 [Lautropia sp.]|nr:hypothetical protein [Lautropia sp.]